MPRKIGVLMARFESKIHHEPMSGCWLWGGALDSNGYGQLRRDGARAGVSQATALALMLYRGMAVPHGMVVCHHCDNPPCVNPDHLFLGTHQDNCDDKHRKGRARFAKGADFARSAMTDDDVLNMRNARAFGEPLTALAHRYGITCSAAGHICVGRTWAHVGGPRTNTRPARGSKT